jgi:hypothetical protein
LEELPRFLILAHTDGAGGSEGFYVPKLSDFGKNCKKVLYSIKFLLPSREMGKIGIPHQLSKLNLRNKGMKGYATPYSTQAAPKPY